MLVKEKRSLKVKRSSKKSVRKRGNASSEPWYRRLAGYFGKVDLDIDLEALRSR